MQVGVEQGQGGALFYPGQSSVAGAVSAAMWGDAEESWRD